MTVNAGESGCMDIITVTGLKYTLYIKDASKCQNCNNSNIRVRLYENDTKEKTGVTWLLGAEFDIDSLAELMLKNEQDWIWKKRNKV